MALIELGYGWYVWMAALGLLVLLWIALLPNWNAQDEWISGDDRDWLQAERHRSHDISWREQGMWRQPGQTTFSFIRDANSTASFLEWPPTDKAFRQGNLPMRIHPHGRWEDLGIGLTPEKLMKLAGIGGEEAIQLDYAA